jgi:hypothetical protein
MGEAPLLRALGELVQGLESCIRLEKQRQSGSVIPHGDIALHNEFRLPANVCGRSLRIDCIAAIFTKARLHPDSCFAT